MDASENDDEEEENETDNDNENDVENENGDKDHDNDNDNDDDFYTANDWWWYLWIIISYISIHFRPKRKKRNWDSSLAFDMTNLLLVRSGSWTWAKKSLGSEAQITHEAHHIPTPRSQPHFAGWRGISLIFQQSVTSMSFIMSQMDL